MNSFYWATEPKQASRYQPENKPFYGDCYEHGQWENWWVPECPCHDGLGHLNARHKKKPNPNTQDKLFSIMYVQTSQLRFLF